MSFIFKPTYTLSAKTKKNLKRIDDARDALLKLELPSKTWRLLQETVRLHTTHYSTMIEGNKLTADQVEAVIKYDHKIGGRERDIKEVQGYYKALKQVEAWGKKEEPITQKCIQKLHALVMAGGKGRAQPTPYRTGQNVIYDGASREIVYMPPEAKDVPKLMEGLVDWLAKAQNNQKPASPIAAALVHYQFVTIHPYYDGNGRTARLLTELVLMQGGYSLQGVYSLEEYYVYHLGEYSNALALGPSHNYYMGRAEAALTPWIDFFCEGMAVSCENAVKRAKKFQDL